MHSIVLTTILIIAAMSITLALWTYWALVFPVIRKELGFRIEHGLDRLKLLALEGGIKPSTALYARVSTFLEESREASENLVGMRVIVDQSDVRKRTIELRALRVEINEADPVVREMVDINLNLLVALWVAQRPALVLVFAVLAPLSYFVGAAKHAMHEREVEYAAAYLSYSR